MKTPNPLKDNTGEHHLALKVKALAAWSDLNQIVKTKPNEDAGYLIEWSWLKCILSL